MSSLLLVLRIIFAIACAFVCLLAWSYPHSFAPSMTQPLYGGMQPEFYQAGGWLSQNQGWLIALALLYIVSLLGERKNVVWFTAWVSVLAAAVIAWPLLVVWYPEYIHPTFSYEDGKLAHGVFIAVIFCAVSALLRLGLLRFLFNRPLEGYEGNEVELHQLDVSKARTVKEIASSPGRVRASFLYGPADAGVIARFYGQMRLILAERRAKLYLIFSTITLMALWFGIYPQVMLSAGFAQQRDRERMYENYGARDGSPEKSQALYAAYRVLAPIVATDKLQGMTIAEAEQYLGLRQLDADLRAQLREESAIKSKSSEDIHQSRRRFLTLEDGARRLVLYLRLAADQQRINFAELEEEGWNARIDEQRRRHSGDWRSNLMSR